MTEEDTDIIIGTKFGYAVRFNQSAVRGMSRIATGVKGVNLRDGDTVVGASVITDQDEVLIITEKDLVNAQLRPNIQLKVVVVKGCKPLRLQKRTVLLLVL